MTTDGNRLEGARVGAGLPPGAIIGREVRVRDEVDSTNDEIGRLGAEGVAEGIAVFAESQRRGRGRRRARWVSAPGKDLLFSVLLRPGGSRGGWTWLTHGAGVAVCRVIEAMLGLPAKLKWPNDVYLEGNRKVSGILVETGTGEGGDYAVLGIGLNVNAESFSAEIGKTAISLREACGNGGELERESIAAALLGELDAVYRGGREEESARRVLLSEAEGRSVLLNRAISFRIPGGEASQGWFAGLGEGGELRIRGENGDEREYAALEKVRIIG